VTGFDTGLVRAARAGQRRALDELVAACLPLVYNLVGRALPGRPDIDDVVQETLLRVVRHLSELRDVAAFRSWLVAITVRQIRDFQRQTSRYRSIDVAEDLPDPGSDVAGATVLRLSLGDQRREVAEATRWLDPDDQELLALWWLEEAGELDRRELAGALNLSGRHAAVRVARMKAQLVVARTVVRALQASPGCPALRVLAADWDGSPSPLWRKRFARHQRRCTHCQHSGHAMVPVDRLLAGSAMLPVPAVLEEAVRSGVAHPVAPTLVAGMAGKAAAAAAVAVAVLAGGYLVLTTRHPAPRPAPVAAPSAVASATASPSQSSAPSPGRTQAPPPAAPAPTGTAKAKKGVGAWTFAGASAALAQSGATWYYTWSTGHPGLTTPAGVGFVPMIHAAADVTAAKLAQAKAAGRYLLGFNEPDMAAQANMSVGQALDLWPQLAAAGQTLGSPAVAAGADRSGGWLDQFMAGAAGRGYRVDFVTLHWYGGDFDPTRAVDQLRSYIQAVYQRYHRPIWLTEYALIDFAHGPPRYPTQTQQAAFLAASASMLDGLPYLQRYAWFGLGASDTAPTGLFAAGPVATPVGRAFQTAGH
jgi:RNA polymerase sigma factor (sigma-70 family)